MSEINTFKNYCKISQEIEVFKKVLSQDVSSEKRNKLHRDLEKIQDRLSALHQTAENTQGSATRFFGSLQAMEAEVVSLYGAIEDRFEETEVSTIASEALKLGSELEKGRLTDVARLVHDLRGHIQFLFKHRQPSLHNRKILQLTLKLADGAAALAIGGPSNSKLYCFQLIAMLKTLVERTTEQLQRVLDPEEAQLAIDLYEVADLFYHHYKEQAKQRLKELLARLPASKQNALNAIKSDEEKAKLLIAIAAEITLTDDTPLALQLIQG